MECTTACFWKSRRDQLSMPRASSTTGLLAARLRSVKRPKPKKVELVGSSVPAPFVLRPFAGLFNPYPYGCSVLCNHPGDDEAKEVVRRAKDTWATEGKALLLPSELERIRTSLREATKLTTEQEGPEVPEELFRRYTQTDSRAPSPEIPKEPEPPIDAAKERTTLVLDLRTTAHEVQESDTLSWHALTLEPIPSSRRSESITPGRHKQPLSSRNRAPTAVTTSPQRSVPLLEVTDVASTRSAPTNLAQNVCDEEDEEEDSTREDTSPPMRRRGKLHRKKRKCRRGSIYGQQTEVREPPEPLETQVSQIDEDSRRGSTCAKLEEVKQTSVDRASLPDIRHLTVPSFLPPEILRELSRGLTREVVEAEFNPHLRFALEEVLRVTEDLPVSMRGPLRPQSPMQIIDEDVPRLFYRKSARFELLNSESLVDLKPLDYLGRHVYLSEERKLLYGRVFNLYRDTTIIHGPRYIQIEQLPEALREVMGHRLSETELATLDDSFGESRERLDFRTWCGVCAYAERSLPQLDPREDDPESWLERADFSALESRLAFANCDEHLTNMLRLIRDR